jgi:hypothetical protein
MVVASLSLQVAAIGFFFFGMGALSALLTPRLAMLVAVIPLAGALWAWNDLRAYDKIKALDARTAAKGI